MTRRGLIAYILFLKDPALNARKTPTSARQLNTHSAPSALKITDIRFTEIEGAPMRCILLKVFTNQDIVGFGEVRDASSRTYAAMLKERLLGENPCNVDKLFRRIRQFGGHGRQGGGVSGLEAALWDLAGKAFGVPVWQLLGGKFRDRIRIYCDTDWGGKGTAAEMAAALKRRMERGFTFLKMDLGMGQLSQVPGTVSGSVASRDSAGRSSEQDDQEARQRLSEAWRAARNRSYDRGNVLNPLTGLHLTDKGVETLERFVADVRQAIGPEIALATDHFGPFSVEDCIRVLKRLEPYGLAWFEDPLPWHLTEQYRRLASATAVPLCTGEDTWLASSFRPLLETGGISVAHPDVLTIGGIMETKRLSDLAMEHGVAMAIHMAESPVGCMAAVHAAAACENFLALEFHSADVPWWDALVEGPAKPIVRDGFVEVPDTPGLGIESLNEELIAEHRAADTPPPWEPTDRWDGEWSHDRTWS